MNKEQHKEWRGLSFLQTASKAFLYPPPMNKWKKQFSSCMFSARAPFDVYLTNQHSKLKHTNA